ncbi:bifunctional diaminohydroxyphosphoribosylaminopyrimidine deaminase/5-amino-6-(5-phosphoribosylamino)uracil reductase RibD [bacterium]|nr:bifunctional diaminohydroxyphosphoribosylaminopyrimidine deaminase/5-amino-6-(5-phosphoribosylamino)uracil reductase RibD [bacterium]
MAQDIRWMQRSIGLAQQAGNDTRPNPRVGAVVIKSGKVVGEGFHRRAGQPHAEIEALQRAGVKARGANLYVTLEPCSSHGRTPPCSGAIRRAGIKRVIYGSSDVDPRNALRAERILKSVGIRVTRGVLQEECDRLNADYRHWTLRKEPWVILKLAMTLDGALAVPGRRWITGSKARNEVQRIRAGCDAILVGAETVRKDNPRLTVRGPFDILPNVERSLRRQPWRVVVTKSGRLPERAKLLTDALRERTLVYREKGWDSILQDLFRRGVHRLLVEGGAKTAESLISANKVNEVIFFFAPEAAEKAEVRVTGWAGWNWRQASVTGAGRDLCLHGTLTGAN